LGVSSTVDHVNRAGDDPRDTASLDFSPFVLWRKKSSGASIAKGRDMSLRGVARSVCHKSKGKVQGPEQQRPPGLPRQMTNRISGKNAKADARRQLRRNGAHHHLEP
jgi:hypothetical protein